MYIIVYRHYFAFAGSVRLVLVVVYLMQAALTGWKSHSTVSCHSGGEPTACRPAERGQRFAATNNINSNQVSEDNERGACG